MIKKKALITGAAKRIGREIACRFAESGIDIILHYNKSEKAARELQKSVASAQIRTWLIQADLADPEQASALFQKAVELSGPIDILINNASIFPTDNLTSFTPEALYENINVNALAPLLLSRSFAAQKRKGKIINFLDTRITDYDCHHASYHLSKRMLYDLTRLMAIEFAPQVAVNGVAPGLILPPPGKDIDFLENLKHSNPLHSYGTLPEITDTVMFLLKAEFITGQVIYVDGGRHLKGCTYGS
ncbi:MAG: SDR family oxidoreductase [Spirochaetales bacterium]|nr:SDR family oxidoreductase [Spirochaetales bacterium]